MVFVSIKSLFVPPWFIFVIVFLALNCQLKEEFLSCEIWNIQLCRGVINFCLSTSTGVLNSLEQKGEMWKCHSCIIEPLVT